VLADDVRSALDVPPADNTAMDGYALRCADVREPARCCRSASAFPPGRRRRRCSRHARRASSPARRCPRRRRVVMQEQCEAVDGGVRIDTLPAAGPVDPPPRRRRAPARRAARGDALTPQALGLAASVGAATLRSRAARASRCSRPATSS
jgi:molybdopterin molybdotransferase